MSAPPTPASRRPTNHDLSHAKPLSAGRTRRYPSGVEQLTYDVRGDRALWAGRTLAEWADELVRTLATTFDPASIVLFGSVADGSDGPDSDIDMLVVLDEAPVERRRELLVAMRRATRSIAAPHDLVVTSIADLARHGGQPGSLEYEPAQHGRRVYERRAS
jgi:uncharacterized protein